MTDILIVDDEPQVRQLLKQYLEAAGYECRTAEDVAVAKVILEGGTFDLILSDIDMPGESGFDLIRHVSKNCPDTPMIMVSVQDKPEKAKEALGLGVYGYIVKPFTRNIILINVENALQRKRLEFEKKAYLEELEALVRKRTETLKNQLTLLQTLSEAIPSPIFYKNKDGLFQGCNTAFEMLAGKKREHIIGKTALEAIPTLMTKISYETDRKLISNPGKIAYKKDVVCPDKSTHSFLINKATILDINGNVAGLVGMMVDITELKAAEEALRASEEKIRQIVENIGIGVAMVDKDMKILWMNNQMSVWFPGIQVNDKPVCHRTFNTPHQELPCNGCPVVKTIKHGKTFESEIMMPITIGDRQFRIIASPIHDKDGKVVAAIELVEEITEKIAMERELRQAQKLESIGQLAAGIAHEINTPIQYVGDNTRFLKEAFGDLNAAMTAYGKLLAAVQKQAVSDDIIADVESTIEEADIPYLSEEIPSAIEQSQEGVQRVSKIVRAMREFSHPGTDRKVEVDLNQALESTITVASNEWKYVSEMETDFEANMPAVTCFPGEMNQVFLNLIINASHAISDVTDGGRQGKGKITVSTRASNGAVVIRIRDTGSGIPEAIQNRIFDPFFTTKVVGKGTGQGLSIAHRVVKDKHGGTLRFDTENGKGTTFIIELPLTDPTEEGKPDNA